MVIITNDTKVNDQYGQSIKSGDFVEAYSKARVVYYNDKHIDKTKDDIVKIKIISGDVNL